MSLQWPAPLFASGGQNPATAAYVDFTTAQPVGLPVFDSPVPSSTAEYIFSQPFMQFRQNFAATALGTAHPSSGLTPDYSTYGLVHEGERRDMEGGLVRWIRTYAIKPATHLEPESANYNYIGFVGQVWTNAGGTPGVGGGAVNPSTGAVTIYASPLSGGSGWPYGRPRFQRLVNSLVRHDYFIAGPSGGSFVTPDYASGAAIPSNLATSYKNTESSGLQGLFTDSLFDAFTGWTATNPGRTEYNSWIANAASLGFLGGVARPAWSASAIYAAGDIVIDGTLPNVSQYVCILAVGPSVTHPVSDTTHWTNISVSWSSSGVYSPLDVVRNSSTAYNCILGVGPSATVPGSDPTHWNVYAPALITAEDSRLARWQGNIFVRQTRYVLAY